MRELFSNVRFYVLAFSVLLSAGLFVLAVTTIAAPQQQIIELEQLYSLISLVFLYLALLAGPFCYRFRWFPYRESYLKSRRALGVATFYFALLHTLITFFGQLGGFSGLSYLSQNYIWAVMLGFIALIIFFFLTITSLDIAVEKMTFPKWKLLHRFIYLAGIFVLIHVVMLGTDYTDLSGIIPLITLIALVFLLILEEPRFYKFLTKIIPVSPIPEILRALIISGFTVGIIFFVINTIITPLTSPENTVTSFSIHNGHKEIAQAPAQQSQPSNATVTSTFPSNSQNIPGLDGDRNKRYTVSMRTEPMNPQPGQNVTIHFDIYDADSGNRVTYFRLLYTSLMHMMTVNSDLTYFNRSYPRQDGKGFVINTQFPKNDLYHLYLQFQPLGGIEQQMAFTLPVGTVPSKPTLSQTKSDSDKAKKFGDYLVSVDTHGPLQAAEMSRGTQKISVTMKDAKTGKPVTNLKPYLNAYGHITMINEQTFDFIHVHPYDITPPVPDASGGPTVDFLPIGIYGPFKPGMYRLFAEMNPNNKVMTADFTVKVQ